MGAITPEQTADILAVAPDLGEARRNLPPEQERREFLATVIDSLQKANDIKVVKSLAVQTMAILAELENDRSKITQEEWDRAYKPQADRIRQLLGRLYRNENDQAAAVALQTTLPHLGRRLERIYPVTPDRRTQPLDQQTVQAPQVQEAPETDTAAQLETALKTREPKNIMEVVEGIMDNADKVDFKVGGKYALVRYEKVKTQFGDIVDRPMFIPENYVRWFRDRMMTIRDDFSPNKHENYWTGISINMGFRTMNFIKMYDLANAWKLEEFKVIGKDPNDGMEICEVEEAVDKNGRKLGTASKDKKTKRVTFVYDKENAKYLQGLKDEIVSTVTMANYMYRNDTLIRPGAGSETDFAKGYYTAFENNELTKNGMGSGYGHMYFLNEASKEEVDEFKENGTKKRGKVGKAAQIATLLYYNLKHISNGPNWYGYYQYEDASTENWIKPGEPIKEGGVEADEEIEIPKWIKVNGRILHVGRDGNVINPPSGLPKIDSIFDNILNADVNIEMGKEKTVHIDGVKEFYSSLARRGLLKEIEKRIESEKDETQKNRLKSIKETIDYANKAGINWLSPIDENRRGDYINRIRPLIAGEKDKFDTSKMSDEKWNEVWGQIVDLPNEVSSVISKIGDEQSDRNKDGSENTYKKTVKAFTKNQSGNERREFTFALLRSLGIISNEEALNLFNRPFKSKDITDIVRGAVVDTIRAKVDIDDIEDAKFADFLNNMLWDTFMIYGMNDTGYVGFRGYSKVMNIRGYRRKSVDYRQEKNGNLFDIDDIKGLLLDPMRAWTVTDEGKAGGKRSFLQEVQGNKGEKDTGTTVNLNDMKRFSFEVGTEKQYAGDPVSNSAKVYQALVDPHAIDFLKDLSWGKNGEIQRGPGFRAMMELLHDIRYSLDRDYPYDKPAEEWYQDQDKHWRVRNTNVKKTMFSNAVIGMNMYDPKSETLDGHQRFPPSDEKRKMGRDVFFFVMQRWLLARRVPSSGLPQLERNQIELIRTAYKSFPTAWKNINGKQVPTDFTLLDAEWKKIEDGFDYTDPDTKERKHFEGFHTRQTWGSDLVESHWLQGTLGFVGQTGIAVRDLARLLLRTDWH